MYDILAPCSVGDVVTYADLGNALDLDPDVDRHAIQMAVRRAAQEFLVVDSHALDVVKNHGYRVVEAREHIDLARRQQRRAGKALARGHDQVVHVDINALDIETRKAFEVVAGAFAQQRLVIDRLNIKHRRLEEAMDAMRPRVDRSETEIAELKERLARVERGATPEGT